MLPYIVITASDLWGGPLVSVKIWPCSWRSHLCVDPEAVTTFECCDAALSRVAFCSEERSSFVKGDLRAVEALVTQSLQGPCVGMGQGSTLDPPPPRACTLDSQTYQPAEGDRLLESLRTKPLCDLF